MDYFSRSSVLIILSLTLAVDVSAFVIVRSSSLLWNNHYGGITNTISRSGRRRSSSSNYCLVRSGKLEVQFSSDSNNNSNDNDPFEILRSALVIDPRDGTTCSALNDLPPYDSESDRQEEQDEAGGEMNLVVVMPQLGDFDSAEYAELLAAVQSDLENANIGLRIIGYGDILAVKNFAKFSGLPLNIFRIDPEASIHRKLQLHCGPNWDIPSFVPLPILQWFAKYVKAIPEEEEEGEQQQQNKDSNTNNSTRNSITDKAYLRAVAKAWLNYMAMCAGIGAPNTLKEILRGYIGDKSAPERIRPNEIVRVPSPSTVSFSTDDDNNDNDKKNNDLITIKGVTDVQLGPIYYQSLWKNERGYQRPAELATVRLRIMVEVLSNFHIYVTNQQYLHYRGATYLFDNHGKIVYDHIDTGVLAYSATMARPLTFLEPYIGYKALNPLGLGDHAGDTTSNNK